jgi:hypothetical protein
MAMEYLAKTIAKNGGVAAVTIQEGADRLRELETEVEWLTEQLRIESASASHCLMWSDEAEAECLEQARLLGMSASREASLLGKISQLERQIENKS